MALTTKRFIRTRKSSSCSMPGVWRAVAFCEGMVVIFHSPRACAHIARTMDINSHYRTLADCRSEYSPAPLLSSQLEEKHSIFGGAGQLEKCIDFAVTAYKPECLAIANSCVVGVIGDDVEAVARSAEKKYGLPVITVDCYGFLDGEYYDGYIAVTKKLIDRFMQPQEHEKGTVFLLGDNGGPWGPYAMEVKRLLEKMDLKVLGQFPGYWPVRKLNEIPRAEAAIVLGGRGQSHISLEKIAEDLRQRFGIKYLADYYPVGLEATKRWILGIGGLLGREDEAVRLLDDEEQRINQAVREFLPLTKNKKVVLCIGRWLFYFHPADVVKMIERLQMDLTAVVLLDAYNDGERQKMLEAVAGCTAVPVHDAADGGEVLNGADLVFTTHELKDKRLKQIFLPMIPKVGSTGEIELMGAVCRTLCSRISQGRTIYV